MNHHEIEVPDGFEKIRSNAFKSVYYNPHDSCILSVWLPEQNISEDEYKSDAIESLELMKSLKAKNYIADNRQATFMLDYNMNSWYAKNIIEHWGKTGIKRLAVVLGEDLNHHATAFNLLDHSIEPQGLSELRYFGELESALKWVRSAK